MVIITRVLSKIYSPKSLYKYLFRECEKLPKHAKEYYKHSIKQSYKQHIFEPDPERIQQIIDTAVRDAQWVLEKYKVGLKKDSPDK